MISISEARSLSKKRERASPLKRGGNASVVTTRGGGRKTTSPKKGIPDTKKREGGKRALAVGKGILD